MGDAGPSLPQILAAVVTFNPDPDLVANLRALRDQLAHVVVIDNGSSNIDAVRRAAAETGCRLVENGENLGIGAALSQAARLAQAGKFEWVATFDQDSLAPSGAFAALVDLYARHPERDRIGVLAMSHRDRATGKDYHGDLEILEDHGEWRYLRTTITSGSMMPVAIFDKIGMFEDRFFMDGIDLEFCLRCRRNGFHVVESAHYTMEHSIGEATPHRLIGYGTLWCTNHSPMRRYYITRNHLEVAVRYLKFDPTWSTRVLSSIFFASAATVVFEDRRVMKGWAIVKGCFDYALRRFGPRHVGLQLR